MARRPLLIEYRPIETLHIDPKNARLHDRRQVRKIANSIRAFDFNVPVLVDANLKVIAGHGRLLACQELGWPQIPTICLEHLSEAQAKAFMIADNRLTETSTWNEQLLALNLKELSELNLDFSLEATGFAMGEIDLRIEGLADNNEATSDPADAVPPLCEIAVNRSGDLWLLGRHRVLCGNSLESSSYTELLQDELAVMVFTDPPYNVPIEGHVSGLGAVHHREFAMASGEMTEGEFTNFLARTFQLLGRHSADGALHYICMDWRHMGETLSAGRGTYSGLKNLCVWVKHQAGMGSLYRSQHELVFVFKKGRAPHRNNVELGKHGRHRSNVWHYQGASNFGHASEEGHLASLHPTVKPVGLVADAIADCTARGEVVLDAFLGSGTSLIAAERRGRRCYGIEIDPLYVDLAIRRWQAHTGEIARNAATGEAFSDLEHRHGSK